MKTTMILALSLMSFNSFAMFNEVECETTTLGTEIVVTVEQPFPASSVFRRVNLTVISEGRQSDYDYTVTARRSPGFQQIQYSGAGLRLEVDHWPDKYPRWGRIYRGSMTSSDYLNHQTIRNLQCRFPNAQ